MTFEVPKEKEPYDLFVKRINSICGAEDRKEGEAELIKELKKELKDAFGYETKDLNQFVKFYRGKENVEEAHDRLEDIAEAVNFLKSEE